MNPAEPTGPLPVALERAAGALPVPSDHASLPAAAPEALASLGAAGTALCRNCGAVLFGRYCATCGQAAEVHVPTTLELIHEALEGLTHSDSRLWRTLACLWFRPGGLTNAFVAGRRASYLPPFRLYLVVSVIFFLLASMSHPALQLERAREGKVDFDRIQSNCARLEVGEHADWTRRLQHACVQVVSDHGSSLLHLAAATMPKAMFLFLPLIAFLHMLLYWWPRHRYAEHLLFFLHLHAFIFCAAILYLLVGDAAEAWPVMQPVDDFVGNVLFWGTLVYTFMAMRRVFRRGWLNLAVKFGVLYTVYLAVLALTVTGVFLYAALQL
jgi:hypothetical protein